MGREVFVGSMIHVNNYGEVIFKDNVAILVEKGMIIDVLENPDELQISAFNANEVIKLSQGQFIIPGFIDCRIHVAQFPNSELGCSKTPLDYLENHTFPFERLYTDKQFAEKVFETVVEQTIQNGTTTACYFASLYTDISIHLADIVSLYYQRAFIGKAIMNVPRIDKYYESTESSIESTLAFIQKVQFLENNPPLVQPIIMPRFALSCDMELMQELATIAKINDVLIQSQISESKDEVKAVKEKFGKDTYTDVYDSAGLLTNKTTLAHGIYLEDSELNTLANREISIIHCPTSNINLKSGLCDVRRLMAYNINIGLGTDISFGSNYSMLNEMRAALHVSNTLSLTGHDHVPLDYKDVFSMATLGGAKALWIEDIVGNFMPGKEFDALVIDLNAKDSFLDDFREYTLEEQLQRFIYSGTSDNIVSVYVRGRKIFNGVY